LSSERESRKKYKFLKIKIIEPIIFYGKFFCWTFFIFPFLFLENENIQQKILLGSRSIKNENGKIKICSCFFIFIITVPWTLMIFLRKLRKIEGFWRKIEGFWRNTEKNIFYFYNIIILILLSYILRFI
jgi:hypothetical protein